MVNPSPFFMTTTASTSRPLETLKRIPASNMPSASSHQHKHKRARLSAPMTPQPSSDIDVENHSTDFKLDSSSYGVSALPSAFASAVPLRVSQGPMTPSTSTVAFSSSPRRMMPSSSPTKFAHAQSDKNLKSSSKTKSKSRGAEHDLTLTEGTTLIFGRHRHSHSTSSTTTLSSSIPKNLSHLLAHPENDASVVHLSRHASHASRVHAAVELIPSSLPMTSDIIRIVVVGQNGMRVRVAGKKTGVRLVQGQTYDLPLPVGQAGELDFFGCKALVRVREAESAEAGAEAEARGERLFSSSPVRQAMRLDLASSMPPSSPPMMGGMDLEEELSEEEPRSRLQSEQNQPLRSSPIFELQQLPAMTKSVAEVEKAEEEEDRMSRQSSPLSSPSEGRQSPLPELEEPASPIVAATELATEHVVCHEHTEKTIKAERIENISHPNAHDNAQAHGHGHGHAKPMSRAASPALPVPEDVDLPAIIASTVVFSGSSKLSLPDLVKHMLESQPSLKEHGPESQWSKWVSHALESNGMFGKVERHGKDSSGHPLLPHYFYNPAEDSDTQRAKELGALVRPLRTAQRTGGKTIDWRPVGRGRRF